MTSPVSMPAGHEIVAADLDAYENLTSAWTAYTPTWSAVSSNPALGNGTLTGAYFRAGNFVYVRIVLTVGSTSTFGSGFYSLSLPVAPKLNSLLSAYCDDNSASLRYTGVARITSASATGDNMRIVASGGTAGASSTSPFTWATSDVLILHGAYEAN